MLCKCCLMKYLNKVMYFFSVTDNFIILTGRMEGKLVLELCLKRRTWKLVEMYILLTDDIVEIDMRHVDWRLDVFRAAGIKLPQNQQWILPLLKAKCPVSNSRNNMIFSFGLEEFY